MTRRVSFYLFAATAVWARSPSPAAEKAPKIQVQGSLRSRVEAWDWFTGEGNGTYAFSGNILRLSLTRQSRLMDWQLEFAAPFLLGLPENSVAPAPQNQLGFGGLYYTTAPTTAPNTPRWFS